MSRAYTRARRRAPPAGSQLRNQARARGSCLKNENGLAEAWSCFCKAHLLCCRVVGAVPSGVGRFFKASPATFAGRVMESAERRRIDVPLGLKALFCKAHLLCCEAAAGFSVRIVFFSKQAERAVTGPVKEYAKRSQTAPGFLGSRPHRCTFSGSWPLFCKAHRLCCQALGEYAGRIKTSKASRQGGQKCELRETKPDRSWRSREQTRST